MDKMNSSKTTSIEQEIIVLLNKKYNNNNYYYGDSRTYYLNNINREMLETQLNYNNNDLRYPYSNSVSIDHINKINNINIIGKIIDTYLEIDGYICYYDIDILNLLLKFIIINRKLTENENENENNNDNNLDQLNHSYLDIIYNYFYNYNLPLPKEKNKEYIKDINYFRKTYNNLGLNKTVIDKFYFIVEEIIIPFSTYILL